MLRRLQQMVNQSAGGAPKKPCAQIRANNGSDSAETQARASSRTFSRNTRVRMRPKSIAAGHPAPENEALGV